MDAYDTITKLRQRLGSEFRARYEGSEQMVREQLVIPMLRAIGWDPEDPAQVQANVAPGADATGYTLLRNGASALFVQVSRAGVALDDPRLLPSALREAVRDGNRYVALTNGVAWMLVRGDGGGVAAERVLWRADIERDLPQAFLRKLLSLGPEAIERHDELMRRCQILDEAWDAAVMERESLVRVVTPVIAEAARQAHADVKFELDEISDYTAQRLLEALGTAEYEPEESEIELPPSVEAMPIQLPVTPSGSMKLPEGTRRIRIGTEEFSVQTPLEMLVVAAEWLVTQGKLKTTAAPVFAGPNRYLVNREPKHRDRAMVKPHRLSNGLFLETHHSPANCIVSARKLLSSVFPEAKLEIL